MRNAIIIDRFIDGFSIHATAHYNAENCQWSFMCRDHQGHEERLEINVFDEEAINPYGELFEMIEQAVETSRKKHAEWLNRPLDA